VTDTKVLDTLIEDVQKRQNQPIKPNYTLWLLIVILAIIVGTYIWGIVRAVQTPTIRDVEISNVAVVGESALCPGDLLIISYDLKADGTGKLVEDAAVWIEVPPKTVIYSITRPFLVDGLVDQREIIAWKVPLTYTNPATLEETPLPPGPYRRIFSVGNPSDDDDFDLDKVDFSVKENKDCPPMISWRVFYLRLNYE
jgi:hypothetical protein